MNTTQSWCLATVTGWGESLRIRSTGEPTAHHQGPVGGTRYIFANWALASHRRLPVTSNVRPLKLQVASHSKLAHAPFSRGKNNMSVVAVFPQIVAVRANASRSVSVRVHQLGFEVGSCCSFHQPSCVKRSPAIRHVPSSMFVKCASRRRAAPRSQFVEAAAGRRRPGLRVVSRPSYTEDAAVVGMACNTVALQASGHAAPQRSNPSVNRRANGTPPGPVWRYAIQFRQPGPGVVPSSPGYLTR